MAKFINSVYGMVSEADLIQTGFNISRPNDPFEGLFAPIQTENLVAEWYTIASEYQVPQMAQFHAFDTISQKTVRAPVDEHNVEKGLIKVKNNTSELLRQLLHRGVTNEERLYEYVIDDNAQLADQVVTRAKVARAEALATGQVTIKENNLDITVSYGVPAGNTADLDVGEGASTDLVEQIQDVVDRATADGVALTGMICSKSLLTRMRKNSKFQKAVNGTAAAGVMLRAGQLASFLDEEFGISQIITNDLTYSTPWTMPASGQTATERPVTKIQRYFPKDRVTFFGTVNGMRLGADLWGVPPEIEINGMGANVSGSSVSPYVYVTQWAEKDPAVVWTKASALYMPALFAPQALYLGTVADTPAANG